jgi:hypothetical protein
MGSFVSPSLVSGSGKEGGRWDDSVGKEDNEHFYSFWPACSCKVSESGNLHRCWDELLMQAR